jgi:CheY-like chemotaxis protein
MSALRAAPSHVMASSGTLQPVLLVDDNPVTAATSETLLASAGYQVASEPRGDAVLRLVRTMYMRMVVTELYVPCAEGPCVATILGGERRRYPRLRVVVLTGHNQPKDRAWAMATRCDVILAKGAAASGLVREVRRLDDYSAAVRASAYALIDLPS